MDEIARLNDTMSNSKVKWLTYLIYLLLTVMSAMIAWNTNQIIDMKEKVAIGKAALSNEYVRLERYQADNSRDAVDRERIYQGIKEVNTKLDRLIEVWIAKSKSRSAEIQ